MANRAPAHDPHVFSISDLKLLGSAKLATEYRDYYNEGAMDMVSLRENELAFERYKILPRVLKNVSNVDTSSTIFGRKVAFPLGFSPSAMHRLAHPDGEIATSRAAAAMGIAMCLSSYANTAMEEVVAESQGNPYMVQICVVKDHALTVQFLKRAEAAGYKAVFLSVDVPVLGRRLNEMRNNFTLPNDLTFPNILSTGHDEFTTGAGGTAFDDALEWSTAIPWLRKNTNMEIWLKGVLSPVDVELAISYGVDGIIVSNHGGRQLDGVPATLDALRTIAPTARNRIQLAMDGGIRRGSDIFKAIALGAQHCFIGRIPIWGLAYKGQDGVELAVKLLLDEFRTVMALAGCQCINDISVDHLTYLDRNGLLAKL